jgi:signal transduction histidine kinase
MKPGTPAAVLVHLDRVRAGGQRAADLVSLLRRQLRADGRSASLPVPVSIADAVREMVELLRPAFPRGMVVDLALAADAFVVTSEPVQVHQVVLNLVLNASQALEGHPAPRLRIALDAAPGASGREAVLVVEDNGPGMPPDVRARCFDAYYSTRMERRGSGLGLAVVRMLVVDALHGDVRVDEAPGGGARFTVRLPVAEGALPGEPSGDAPSVVAEAQG